MKTFQLLLTALVGMRQQQTCLEARIFNADLPQLLRSEVDSLADRPIQAAALARFAVEHTT